MLARNEDWIIGLSARAALMWCDYLVVGLHRCNDKTNETLIPIIEETDGPIIQSEGIRVLDRRLIAMQSSSAGWPEMDLRQGVFQIGRSLGGTHFAIIDADEILSGNLLPRIRRIVEGIPDGQILTFNQLALASTDTVYSSGMWANQIITVGFKDAPYWHWTVAPDGYHLHSRHPHGVPFTPCMPVSDRSAGVMHLQFVSRRRFLSKQFLYQLHEKLVYPGRDPVEVVRHRYAQTVIGTQGAKTEPVPAEWWEPYRPFMQYLDVNREPWQEGECKRIIRENPGIQRGLDDFGLLREWGIAK